MKAHPIATAADRCLALCACAQAGLMRELDGNVAICSGDRGWPSSLRAWRMLLEAHPTAELAFSFGRSVGAALRCAGSVLRAG